MEHAQDSDGQRKQEAAPIEEAQSSYSAPTGCPCCCYHVDRQHAAQHVTGLVLHEGEVRAGCAHAEHGDDKNVSGQAVPVGALAEQHCRGAGKHPEHTAANVKDQYG